MSPFCQYIELLSIAQLVAPVPCSISIDFAQCKEGNFYLRERRSNTVLLQLGKSQLHVRFLLLGYFKRVCRLGLTLELPQFHKPVVGLHAQM